MPDLDIVVKDAAGHSSAPFRVSWPNYTATPPTGTPTFPTPQTTGVPAGTKLTNYTGPSAIPAGTTLTGQNITKSISNVGALTLKNCKITSGDLFAVTIKGPGDVLIEDCEITGTYDRSIDTEGRKSGTLTCRRLYAHEGLRGIDVTGDQTAIRFEDCYMAFNSNPGSGERSHASAVRAAGSIRSFTSVNTVWGVGANSWASGIIATYPENGYNSGLTILGGLFIVQADNDGAYGIAAGYTPPGEQPNRNFVVRDLWISTEYYASGCPSGCAQNWNKLTGTNEWTNVRKYNPGKADHGKPISA